MAITPWDWNSSNGSASAAQTRTAYAALLTQSNTTNFSRYVWNDLVNKIYEVVRALSRNWNKQYASLSATRASYQYQSWTAAMFNSARLNTGYPSWTWEYDRTKPSYTGRTEMRGVSQYGDNGADIFYGDYIIELVKRLNTVIGIINGTQDVSELSEAIPVLLEMLSELTAPESTSFPRTRHREILTPQAFLQSENLPTMTLHFVIPTAEIRAVLEQEELSAMMEGYVFASIQTGARINRLHSVLLSQVLPSRASYSALLKLLEGSYMQAEAGNELHYSSSLGQLPSSNMRVFWHGASGTEATAVSKAANGIGWTHYRVRIEPDAELASELNSVMYAAGAQFGTFSAGLGRGTPTRMAAEIDLGEGFQPEANIGLADPFGLTLHHEVDTVGIAADLAFIQLMESMNATMDMRPLTTRATLEYEHISTLLQAYLRMEQTSEAQLSNNVIAGMECTEDIRVEITADVVSDYAPILSKAVEIALTIGSKMDSGFAPKIAYHEYITVAPVATGVTAFVPYLGEIRHNYLVEQQAAVIKRQSVRATAHVRTGIAIDGSSHVCPVEWHAQAAFVFCEPEVRGLLVAKEKLELMARAEHSHGTNAALEYLRGMVSAEAAVAMQLQPSSELGYVYNAPLTGVLDMALLLGAELDSEGGGWQYPVIMETDAAIFQVWLTEQNRRHLFLDPHNGIHHATFRHSVSGVIDHQIRVDASSESTHHLAITGELNKRQRGDWEYPVYEDGVLLITQAIDALPHYQYNLEVR